MGEREGGEQRTAPDVRTADPRLVGKRGEVFLGTGVELRPASEVVASVQQRVRAVHDLVRRQSTRDRDGAFRSGQAVGELARDLHQEDRVPEQAESLLGPLEPVGEAEVASRDVHRLVPAADHRLQQSVGSVGLAEQVRQPEFLCHLNGPLGGLGPLLDPQRIVAARTTPSADRRFPSGR